MHYVCSFARNQWNPDDWLTVRSPRWPEISRWIQQNDSIENSLPDDIRPEDMQMGRDRTGETYISMLLRTPFHGNCSFRTKCAFDNRMAPLLVFSQELVDVHRDHLEVVLYDRGINLWHHYWNGKNPSWELLAFLDLDLSLGQKYDLSAQFIFNEKGVFLFFSCNDHTAGCRLDSNWPRDYFAGFTACEGKNRFFDFEAKSTPTLSEAMSERFSD